MAAGESKGKGTERDILCCFAEVPRPLNEPRTHARTHARTHSHTFAQGSERRKGSHAFFFCLSVGSCTYTHDDDDGVELSGQTVAALPSAADYGVLEIRSGGNCSALRHTCCTRSAPRRRRRRRRCGRGGGEGGGRGRRGLHHFTRRKSFFARSLLSLTLTHSVLARTHARFTVFSVSANRRSNVHSPFEVLRSRRCRSVFFPRRKKASSQRDFRVCPRVIRKRKKMEQKLLFCVRLDCLNLASSLLSTPSDTAQNGRNIEEEPPA